jgi:uncharacterized repeat protein (TIGR01451 family)
MTTHSIPNSIHTAIRRTIMLVGVLTGAMLLVASSAQSQDLVDDVCMETLADFGLQCTANDVSIASVQNIVILDEDGGCSFPGDTVTFQADFEVLLTAQGRHDIGLYFSTDGDPNGDGALTGSVPNPGDPDRPLGCAISTIPYENIPPPDTLPDTWLDLDGTTDKFPGTNIVSNIQDQCGDIDDDHNPLFPRVILTVMCVDADGDRQLDLPNCTSWRQPGANDLCLGPLDAFPGSPAKCRCDDGFNIPIDVPPSINLTKSFASNADEDASGDVTLGDTITYSFLVANDGFAPLSLVGVVDPLPGMSPISCPSTTLTVAPAAGSSMTCTATYVVTLEDSNAGQIDNTATASGTDDTGEMVETVMDGDDEIIPVAMSPELTIDKDSTTTLVTAANQVVDYSYLVTNTGNVSLTGITVTDVTVDAPGVSRPTSQLDPGESMSCSALRTVTQAEIDGGGNLSNIGIADSNETDPVEDPHDIPIQQSPGIEIQKTPDDQTVDTGTNVSFTIRVTNIGNVSLDPVVVSDPLTPDCDRSDLGPLAPGQFSEYTCTHFTVLAPFTNVAFATGTSPTGADVMNDDDANVIAISGDLCEDAKPSSLVVLYTGLGPDGTNNSQAGSEVIIEGDAMDDPQVFMEVFDHRSKEIFSENVDLNTSFVVTGTKQKISPRTTFRISTAREEPCSRPCSSTRRARSR